MPAATATIADILTAYANARVQNARVVAALATEHGIGATDLRAVSYLAGNAGATPKRLAEHLGLTTGAMTTLLDRVETAGFVRRAPNPDDRRSLVLQLTPEGTDLVGHTGEVYSTAFVNALEGLDLDQVQAAFTAVGSALQAIADTRASGFGAAAE